MSLVSSGTLRPSAFISIIALALAGSAGSAFAQSDSERYVPGQVLVAMKPGLQRAAAQQRLAAAGVTVLAHYDRAQVDLVHVPRGSTVEETIVRLMADPAVASASPNYYRHHHDHLTRPNDPDFPRQWYLDNRGQRVPREMHTDGGPNAGFFDIGESVYDDVDESNSVTGPDVLLAGPPGGGALVFFAGRDRYVDANANGRYDAGECMYYDADPAATGTFIPPGLGVVSVGDQRLTPACGPFNVVAGDPDLDRPLAFFVRGRLGIIDADIDAPQAWEHNFDCSSEVVAVFDEGIDVNHPDLAGNIWVNPNDPPGGGDNDGNGIVDDINGADMIGIAERHADNVTANGSFDNGEWIVLDNDATRTISPGDTRVTATAGGGAGTPVLAGQADVGTVLVDFISPPPFSVPPPTVPAQYERHVDGDANLRFTVGEAIYVDNDNSGTVTGGDTLVQGAAAAPNTPLIDFFRQHTPSIGDTGGHGTAVAGCIGARGNNGINIAGVCWRVQLMDVRIGGATGATTADDIAALNYVMTEKAMGNVNVRVINESFGGIGFSGPHRAALNAAGIAGILFVTSAGNDAVNNDPDGQQAEAIYNDLVNPGGNIVEIGDTRLTTVGQPANALAPGPVMFGDADVNRPLTPFAANDAHTDNGPNVNMYDEGERIYQDLDNSLTVSVGDFRRALLPGAGAQYGRGTVVAGDPDLGLALVNFQPSEKYFDADGNGRVRGNAPDFPCSYNLDNILCVGASESRDNLASFSNWGVVSVDLNAPGEHILTLRRTQDGGGVQYINGTSFSSPITAGIAAHFWSYPAFANESVDDVKTRLMTGLDAGLPLEHPNGVDPRYGLIDTVVSGLVNDGRARMVMGDDFSDAFDPPYPTKLNPFQDGARHEDIGEEWLGRTADIPGPILMQLNPPPRTPVGGDVSPEFDAYNDPAWPPDPDGIANLVPPKANLDRHDDGIEILTPLAFSLPAQPRTATVRVYVSTENNGVVDFSGGRYDNGHPDGDGVHGPTDDKKIWVNGFFDWNGNGNFEDAQEQVFMLHVDPATWGGVKGAVYDVTFPMPMAPAGPIPTVTWSRFRLDYGENAGQALGPYAIPLVVGPSPGGTARLWTDGLPVVGPQPNLYESDLYYPMGAGPQTLDLSTGLAQFGEVEDLPAVLLRHFQCFESHRPPLNFEGISLVDQFGPSTVTVKRAKRLCAPADKNDEDPTAPLDPAHLTSYTIKQTAPRFSRIRGVTVTNQFGSLVVDLVKPDRLLVPTAKSLTGAPPALQNPTDHFKCYKVRGTGFRQEGITVATQFGPIVVDIKRPLHLCAPVDKNGEGVIDPVTHLMCYQVRGPRQQSDSLFTNDQLGPDEYPIYGPRELCVPSTKTLSQ